jgi:hypothetical protein
LRAEFPQTFVVEMDAALVPIDLTSQFQTACCMAAISCSSSDSRCRSSAISSSHRSTSAEFSSIWLRKFSAADWRSVISA